MVKTRISSTPKPRWTPISPVTAPPPKATSDSPSTTATSPIDCSGSRSWVIHLILGQTLKGARASPIGLVIARGEEKISKRNLVIYLPFYPFSRKEKPFIYNLLTFVFEFVFLAVTISDIVACPEEQILTDEQPDMDGCPGGDNLDDEGEAMIEEALSGSKY